MQTNELIVKRLFESVKQDLFPDVVVRDAFGIESQLHYDVLFYAIKDGFLSEEEALSFCGTPSLINKFIYSLPLLTEPLPVFRD